MSCWCKNAVAFSVVDKTLQELKAFDKPILIIFNKMDLYEEKNIDPWLDNSVRQEILRELREKWEHNTEGNCIFTSATHRINVDGLRTIILAKVRELYKERYPYKTEYFY